MYNYTTISVIKKISLHNSSPKNSVIPTQSAAVLNANGIFFLYFFVLQRAFFIFVVQYLGMTAVIEPAT